MTQTKETILALATPIIEAAGGYCVDVIVRGEHGTRVVEVLADTDAGITIGQCAEISRALGQSLEGSGAIDGAYRLEVSSPGIDRPLKLLRQYAKNIGRRFAVSVSTDGVRSTFTGVLETVDGDRLTFREENEEPRVVSFGAVLECTEVLPW